MKEDMPINNEYADIKSEIRIMCESDQAMRKRALDNGGIIESEADENLDQKNTLRMKEIIEKVGWPTISKFGEEVAQMAWLLVQHADHDVEFQKKCLELMRAQPENEVDKTNTAYLEDRVSVNEGRPQLYGTQFHGEGENYGPRPIENPEQMDERRKALGMEPMEAYKQSLLEKYSDKK